MFKYLLYCIVFYTFAANGQDDQKNALQEFKVIAGRFEDFFKEPQKLINKQSFQESPSGFSIQAIEYIGKIISYDIKKTESLISPFVAYIDIDVIAKDNSACGNVSYTIGNHKTVVGWDNEKAALASANNNDCYKPQTNITGKIFTPPLERVRLNFAFQDDKWVFKAAIRTKYGNPSIGISNVFGVFGSPSDLNEFGVPSNPGLPLSDSVCIEFNKKWTDLIKQTD